MNTIEARTTHFILILSLIINAKAIATTKASQAARQYDKYKPVNKIITAFSVKKRCVFEYDLSKRNPKIRPGLPTR